MRIDFLLDADEMFLTGTAAEIIAVPQIDETKISDGEGKVTRSLRDRFREIVTSKDIPED